LDFIITGQMLLEKIDSIDEDFKKRAIKKDLKSLLNNLEPIVNQLYAKIFGIEEQATQQIITEYEHLVKSISEFKIPEKVAISQYVRALNYDKTVELAVHEVLKKYE